MLMILVFGNIAHAGSGEFFTSLQSRPHTLSQSDDIAKSLYSKAYRELMDACMSSTDELDRSINQRVTFDHRDVPHRMISVDFLVNDYEVVAYKNGQVGKSGEALYVSVMHMSAGCKTKLDRPVY